MNRANGAIKRIVPFVWIVAGIIWDAWYHVVRGRIMLDSDISAGMLLAQVLNEERSVTGLSHNWVYATGLKFLDMQWLYRIGLLLFPDKWHAARTFSAVAAIMLLAFAMWLVFYSIERPAWGLWAAALAVFPGGGWYFWQTLYGTQYMPIIIISLLCFSLIMLSSRGLKAWQNIMYLLLLVLLAFASGLNGIKQLMEFFAPLMITMLLVFIMEICRLGESAFKDGIIYRGRAFAMLSVSLIAAIASIAGYLINSRVLAREYQFEQYNETKIEYRSFLEYVRMYIWDFGFAEDKVLMSPTGVASMCGVVFGLLVVLSGILLIMRFKELSNGEQVLTALSVVSIVFLCFVFSYVSGHGDIQYFQPVIPFGYCLVVLEIHTERFRFDKGRFIAMNAALIVMLIASAGTVYNENHEPFHKYRARPELLPVVGWLVEQGYTEGVSLFWTSDVVTEMSNGRIEMWTLSDESPEMFEAWAQKKSHLTNGPKGKYFYLFEVGDEDDEFREYKIDLGMAYIDAHPYPSRLQPIYYDDYFIIYGN